MKKITGTIAVANVAQTIFAPSGQYNGFKIVNPDAGPLYWSIGVDATVSNKDSEVLYTDDTAISDDFMNLGAADFISLASATAGAKFIVYVS